MELHLTEKQYRRLLDLVYIGNWVLNSTRGDDRIQDYDKVESLIFSHCMDHGMTPLVELYNGEIIPSRAFAEGGIHEAIMAYEDVTFLRSSPRSWPCGIWIQTGPQWRTMMRSWSVWSSIWANLRPTVPTISAWTWSKRRALRRVSRSI